MTAGGDQGGGGAIGVTDDKWAETHGNGNGGKS